jgi:hypothetical protein
LRSHDRLAHLVASAGHKLVDEHSVALLVEADDERIRRQRGIVSALSPSQWSVHIDECGPTEVPTLALVKRQQRARQVVADAPGRGFVSTLLAHSCPHKVLWVLPAPTYRALAEMPWPFTRLEHLHADVGWQQAYESASVSIYLLLRYPALIRE